MPSDLLQDFPVVIDIPVQWGDQDPLGHVNNVIYFRWWESSRVRFCEQVGIVLPGNEVNLGFILAAVHCDFREQLRYPDTVRIGARTGRIGTKSVQIEHRMVSLSRHELTAEAVSTIVMFDFEAQQSIPVSEEFRRALQSVTGK